MRQAAKAVIRKGCKARLILRTNSHKAKPVSIRFSKLIGLTNPPSSVFDLELMLLYQKGGQIICWKKLTITNPLIWLTYDQSYLHSTIIIYFSSVVQKPNF